MNKVKKQIIYVWDYLEWGGVQIYFIALMRCLSKKYSVKAILPANSAEKLIDYLRKDNLNFEFFDSEKAASETLGFLGRIRRRIQNLKCNFVLANRLSKEDLGNSIIHIDSSPWANFLFLFYLLLKTDVFITFHTTLPKISKISELIWTLKFSILCKFSSLHIAVSNLEVKESLRKYLSVEKFGKTELAYSGINTDEIKNILKNPVNRENIIERYDFPRTSFWICNVGQFIERKGCWFLLEALKELRLTGESVFFIGWERLI